MNKSNAYYLLSLSITLLFGATATAQPPDDKKQLKAAIARVSQLATELSMEIAHAVVSVDFDALEQETERMVELSVPPPLLGFQKEKVIEKTYTVNKDSRVSIDNRYGDIKVHNWPRNEVKVTVRVRTAENSEKKAQEALDRVRINASQSGNAIAFETNISSGDSNWWSLLTSGASDRALRIDYDVYMPKGNELTLANHYGTIELGDRDGKVVVSVSYGSLRAGRLNARGNALDVAYSKAHVEYLNEGDVAVRYSGFTLSEAETLKLAMSSSGGEIGQVNAEADISLRYSGGFEIGLGSAIQKATVAASYSNVSIKPSADAAFHFNVAVSYGGFDYDRNRTNIGSKAENNSSKSYTGYWNKAVNNTVNVSSRYGAVSLK